VEEAKDELKEIVDFFVRSEGIGTARRAHPEGYPAGRSARYRQDAAGARSCGRSGRQILLNLRLRVCRDVRWRRRGAGAGPV
jgi:hypothetical protein